MNSKTQELLDRTFYFGVNLLKFLRTLPDDFIYRIPKGQVARSCVLIGANYEEAQGAVSKRDFSHKLALAIKKQEKVFIGLEYCNSCTLRKNIMTSLNRL